MGWIETLVMIFGFWTKGGLKKNARKHKTKYVEIKFCHELLVQKDILVRFHILLKIYIWNIDSFEISL